MGKSRTTFAGKLLLKFMMIVDNYDVYDNLVIKCATKVCQAYVEFDGKITEYYKQFYDASGDLIQATELAKPIDTVYQQWLSEEIRKNEFL